MNLSRKDKSRLVRLLGILRDYVESSIESSIVAGTNEPDPGDVAGVAEVERDRHVWKEAEAMIKKLCGRTRACRTHYRTHTRKLPPGV